MKTVPEIAMDFLRRGGKRLRPRICEAAWRSLSGGDASRVAPLAEAVECLHKASLIHDDIQDSATTRYGAPSVWAEHGVPIAVSHMERCYNILKKRSDLNFPPALLEFEKKYSLEKAPLAFMGSVFIEKAWGRKNPSVGLVNLGVEENKGSTLTKAAYEMLARSGLNFTGNVEARELPDGACDVIVCDGFTGNVILKLTEGFALHILGLLKARFTEGTKAKIGALLLKDKLRSLKGEFDYSEYGGAPILGVKGAIVKMHGSSNANAVKNTVLKSIPYVEEQVVDKIQNSVLDIEEIVNSEREE